MSDDNSFTLNDDAANPLLGDLDTRSHPEQFRLTCLQVVNWGPFSGRHRYDIPTGGVLITGPSGTGKSTLQDALSTLLFATGKQGYNASAADSEFGGKDGDRDLGSYVRGAYGSDNEGNEKYLRPEASTWSAVAATWTDGGSRCVTAVGVFHLTDGAVDTGSLIKNFFIHEAPFDIAEVDDRFAQHNYRFDNLKKAFDGPGTHYFPRNFSRYQAKLMTLLGIGSEAALELLSRAKAAKNIGSLDGFVRRFMLDEPATFTIADELCDGFVEIEQLYDTVVDQKRRADALAECPGWYDRYEQLSHTHSESERLLHGPVRRYRLQLEAALTDAELARLEDEQHNLGDKLQAARTTMAGSEQQVDALKDQLANLDGGALGRLEALLDDAVQAQGATTHRRDAWSTLLAQLDLTPADTFEAHTAQCRDAATAAEALEAQVPSNDAVHAAHAALSLANTQLRGIQNELTSLRDRPTAIPSWYFDKRLEISKATGVAPGLLPYAAELIDVRPDEQQWRLAAERVLNSLALTMLVPHEHIEAVKTYVNDNNMRGRVALADVPDHTERRIRPQHSNTILDKIDIVDHPAQYWLSNRIAQGFAAVCVDQPVDMSRWPHAVTREGFVYRPGQYVKNDPRRDAERPPILGSDNKDTVRALERQLPAALIARADADTEVARLTSHRDHLRAQAALSRTVAAGPPWADIDVVTRHRAVGELERAVTAARADDRVATLSVELDVAKRNLDATTRVLYETEDTLRRLTERNTALLEQFERLDTTLSNGEPLPDDDEADLAERFARRSPTLDTLSTVTSEVTDDIRNESAAAQAEQTKLRLDLEKTFTAYLIEWKDEQADLDNTIDSAGDFVARYRDIVDRGLPEREAQFKQRLDTDAVERLSLLLQSVDDERRTIKKRIDQVNASLMGVQYNQTDGGTILKIDFTEAPTGDYRKFKEQVQAAFSDFATIGHVDRRRKRQFDVLRDVIGRLRDPEQRRWREDVLDVRKSFTFHGTELNSVGTVVRSWWNSNSNSGGEQEKLVAFCLAAGLSYQLGTGDRPYTRFGTVMLDEAFSKSDEVFTDQAMSAFTAFGFQLVLAAPIRIAPVLEHYLGGIMLVRKREEPGTRRIASEGFFMPMSDILAEYGGDVGEVD